MTFAACSFAQRPAVRAFDESKRSRYFLSIAELRHVEFNVAAPGHVRVGFASKLLDVVNFTLTIFRASELLHLRLALVHVVVHRFVDVAGRWLAAAACQNGC